jgi:uncharacterized membrane protein
MKQRQLIRGLGWFSIGLGLAEILAPRRLGRSVGIGDHRWLMRLMGMRELASGLGILTRRQPAGWLWSRVAGDLLDLSLLGTAMRSGNSRRGRVAATAAAVAGVTAVDMYCSKQATRTDGGVQGTSSIRQPIRIKRSITVNRPPEEVYQFWHDFENLPRFMSHVKSVKRLGDTRTHWEVKGPAGIEVEWDAEITEDKPNELIAWRSLPGADVENSGAVRFERAPGGRGTVVRVDLNYDPPAGIIGSTLALLFGESPEKQIKADLLRLRQLIETGELARTEGQPAGRSSSTSRKYDDFVRR